MKNSYVILFLKLLRKIYGKTIGFQKQVFFKTDLPDYQGQESSDLIYDELMSSKPSMISRFGSVELEALKYYKFKKEKGLIKILRFITGEIEDLDWPLDVKFSMQNNAGFFPATNKNLDDFSELMLSKISNIDILGSWLEGENEFSDELTNAKKIGLEDLNSYNHKKPWSRMLKGKNVLVIHPFNKSIDLQYGKREKLFQNNDILPKFNLITYRPVVSLADNFKNLLYEDWFEALDMMKNDISNIDFDVAILGCGAYGLPLASFIKEIGKKAVHLGGATQMMFGIVGRRWETEYDLAHLINGHWIRPLDEEIPLGFEKIENGCYW